MNRVDHLAESEIMIELAPRLAQNPDYRTVAAEIVWGATVHALSAADPEHETPNSRTGEHDSPNRRHTFRPAAQRIAGPGLTLEQMEACLENNQGKLHTHFYYRNLSDTALLQCMSHGLEYAQRIIAAAQSTLPAPPA